MSFLVDFGCISDDEVRTVFEREVEPSCDLSGFERGVDVVLEGDVVGWSCSIREDRGTGPHEDGSFEGGFLSCTPDLEGHGYQ